MHPITQDTNNPSGNKTWLITGASAGLGRLLAEQLLARGDHVIATLRHSGALDDLLAQHDGRLQVVVLDLVDTVSIRHAVDEAFGRAGRIDVVVSNAGYGLFGAAEEVTDAQIERQIGINLIGSIQFIRACLAYLRRQGGGRIVQLSSEGGQIAYPNFSLYHASKWGVEGFIEAMAQEVASFGIDCVLVEPGPTATSFAVGLDHAVPMSEYENTPAGEMRRALRNGGFAIRGDAARSVAAMISVIDQSQVPLRLPLGSGAYARIEQGLKKRLEVMRPLQEIAESADVQDSSV